MSVYLSNEQTSYGEWQGIRANQGNGGRKQAGYLRPDSGRWLAVLRLEGRVPSGLWLRCDGSYQNYLYIRNGSPAEEFRPVGRPSDFPTQSDALTWLSGMSDPSHEVLNCVLEDVVKELGSCRWTTPLSAEVRFPGDPDSRAAFEHILDIWVGRERQGFSMLIGDAGGGDISVSLKIKEYRG